MIGIIILVGLLVVTFGMIMVLLFTSRSNDGLNRNEEPTSKVERRGSNLNYRVGLPPDSEPSAREVPAREVPAREVPAREIETSKTSSSIGIRDATVGDLVQVATVDQDLEFRVSGVVDYNSEQEDWRECFGHYRGRRVAIEIFADDASQVGFIAGETEITLTQLGLTEDDLIRCDEGEGLERPLEFDGAIWEFIWSGEVTYTEADALDRDGYYGWDFAEQQGSRVLCVEKREGSPFELCLMQLVDANQVRVLRN